MRKGIRVLEVPLYLLVIAVFCQEQGCTALAIVLGIVSAGRLVVNVITDESVYKK